MAQRLSKSPCEALPHPRCALIFSDFSVYVFRALPKNLPSVSALLKGGISEAVVQLVMGACISMPVGDYRAQESEIKAQAKTQVLLLPLETRVNNPCPD